MNPRSNTRTRSNNRENGNAEDRRRRREWLVMTFAADQRLFLHALGGPIAVTPSFLKLWSLAEPACRCYRCGTLLTVDTVTVDRIIPGRLGGTYRRNNIRPACSPCNIAWNRGLTT